VSWRFGGGYSGWGPLGYGGSEEFYPGYHFIYVDDAHFNDVHYRDHRVPADRIGFVEGQARPMPTRYANGHAVMATNGGPPRTEIEHASGHSIRAVPMAQVAKQQHMVPPAGAKGVHYAKGASASHPFVAQKVQATNHPPAGAAGEHGGHAGGSAGGGNAHAMENGRAGEAGRPGGGEQHPEARPAGGEPRSEEGRPAGEQHPEAAHAATPAAKPKPAAPPPMPKKKKP
jgi:hypothetical protein